MRWMIIVAALLLLVVACGGGDGPSVEERARELLAETPVATATAIVPHTGPLRDITTPLPAPTVLVTVVSPSPTVIVQKPEPSTPGTTFGDGMQVVGTDISPGTYRTDGGDGCYWERLSGFSGSFDDIIANDNPTGQVVVTIAASDAAFSAQRCGTWTRID